MASTLEAAETVAPPLATTSMPSADDRLAPVGDDGVEQRRLKGEAFQALFGGPPPAQMVGRFRVLDRLGAGGMGVVYAAYDEQLDRKVAIKLLRMGSSEGPARARILREAQAMARLSHLNVVTVHEVGEHDGEVFIAMEFVRGQSLDAWARTRPGWRAVVDAYRQAGEGLRAAHAAGVAHRDFKPHNAILGEDKVVKVLDFGLALELDAPSAPADMSDVTDTAESRWARLTRTGALMGTPAYMSPEQYSAGAVGPLSDQFSLCVALYEGLYGELPFAGATVGELSAAVLSGRLRPRPQQHDVPTWLDRVVRRGLSRSPEDRFPDMQTLLAALARDPVAIRRRWLAIGALAGLMGLGGFSVARFAGGEQQPRSCDLGAAERESLWSEGSQQAIAAQFEAVGGADGAVTWKRIAPRIDAYVAGLASARDAVCVAHRDGEQSDQLFDRRSACLDQRAAGLEAVLGSFADASPSTIERAPEAVSGLRPLTRCSDAAALTADVPPPEDPAVAAEVADARVELERARSHELLGRHERASEAAAAIRARADSIGYEPLSAEAWLRLGAAEQERRRGAEAREAMEHALHAALRSRHIEIAAEAAARLIFIDADLLQDPARALQREGVARALTDAVPDPWRAWLLANNIAVAHWMSESSEEALAGFEAALAALGAPPAFALERAVTTTNIGFLLDFAGRESVAIPRLEQALELTQEFHGERHPKSARAALRLAQALEERGRFEESSEWLDAAERSLPPGQDDLGDWIRWTRARGALLRGELSKAKSIAGRVLDERRALHGGPRPDDLVFVGVLAVVAAVHDAEAGRAMLTEAAAAVPDRVDPAYYWRLLGEQRARLGDLVGAREDLDRGRALADRHRAASEQLFARVALIDVALAGDSLTQARASLEEAEEVLRERPALAREVVGAALARARGDVALAAGERERAEEHFADALALLQHADVDFPPRLAAARGLQRARVGG